MKSPQTILQTLDLLGIAAQMTALVGSKRSPNGVAQSEGLGGGWVKAMGRSRMFKDFHGFSIYF